MSRARLGILGVAVGLYVLAAAPANAALECGDAVTKDRKLKADLDCGLNESGLLITANGVDLDLNGHTITGNGDFDTDGILVENRERVRVHGGTIRNFDHGVSARITDDLTVEDTKLKGALGESVRLEAVTNSVIRDNELLENQASSHVFVFNAASENITVARNRMTEGGIDFDAGDNFRATGNTIIDAKGEAIFLEEIGQTVIRGNTVDGGEQYGVEVDGAEETRIEANEINGTDFSGILIHPGAVSISIDDNKVTQASINGITVESGSSAIKVRGNRANNNDNHGIGVTDGDTLIKNNIANGNGERGIISTSSNGSGNKAKNNGDPLQCTPASLCD